MAEIIGVSPPAHQSNQLLVQPSLSTPQILKKTFYLSAIIVIVIPYAIIQGIYRFICNVWNAHLESSFLLHLLRALQPITLSVQQLWHALHGRQFKHYNQIPLDSTYTHQFYVGAQINQLDPAFNKVLSAEKLTIISIQEEWETKPICLNWPLNNENKGDGKKYINNIQCPDFKDVEQEKLDEIAKLIHENLQKNHVYLHCASGQGRSIAATIAFLIKYQGKSPEEAINELRELRPQIDKTLTADQFSHI